MPSPIKVLAEQKKVCPFFNLLPLRPQKTSNSSPICGLMCWSSSPIV
ncbi:hypothetical protein ACLK1T_15365 [Escherichia coli]